MSDGKTKYLKKKETVVVEVGKEDGVVGLIIENASSNIVRMLKIEVYIG